MNRTTGRLSRVGVAVCLTALLLWRSDPAQVWQVTAAANAGWILSAVLLVIVDRALMAYRWFALLSPIEANVRPPFGAVMRVFFVSTFVGTFLPASIGGDLVRAFQLSRYGVSGAAALASVLMDRLLGIVSILAAAAAGMAVAGELVASEAVSAALVFATMVSAAALGAVFSPALAQLLRTTASRARWRRLDAPAASFIDAVQRYSHHRRDLLAVLGCSIGVQGIRIAQAYCLGRALGIAAPPFLYVAAVPVILLVMLLPITINGIGTSQAAFIWFFGRAGVGSAEALALSILFVGLGIIGNLPGGLLYAAGARKKNGSQERAVT